MVTGVNGQMVSSAKLRLYNVASSNLGGDFHRVAANTWYEIDVTSPTTGDGLYSLRVTSLSADEAAYSSKEGTAAPQLVISVRPPPTPTDTPTATATSTPDPSPTPPGSIQFAAIGDYGNGSTAERDVSNLVKSWNPDFVIMQWPYQAWGSAPSCPAKCATMAIMARCWLRRVPRTSRFNSWRARAQ